MSLDDLTKNIEAKVSVFQAIGTSPYSPILLLLLGIYLIGVLDEGQYTRLQQTLPLLRGPLGWGFIALFLIMWINAFMFAPYLTKQNDLVKCLNGLDLSIKSTAETIKIFFHEVGAEHIAHMEKLTRIELDLQAHRATMDEVLRRGLVMQNGQVLKERRKTDKFHVPSGDMPQSKPGEPSP